MNVDNSICFIIFILVGYMIIGCMHMWRRQLYPSFIVTNLIKYLVILHTALSIGILLS